MKQDPNLANDLDAFGNAVFCGGPVFTLKAD